MSAAEMAEPILDPDLPIIDPHHHLHDIPGHSRYLLEDLLADLNTGHNVRATVFAESHAFYRADGPEAMKPVGEVEFANGVAAMAASGRYGDIRVCAAIEGYADLRLGDPVEEVLVAEIQAGNGRLRGVRFTAVHDPDASIIGTSGTPHILLGQTFRKGVKQLHKLGLTLGVTVFEPQLPDVVDLARAFPETQIVLTHCGFPLGIGAYKGRREERFLIWKENIKTLSSCQNVAVKLGGLGMRFGGFSVYNASPPATSEQMAAEWGPYVTTCIEAFGADRCMFES